MSQGNALLKNTFVYAIGNFGSKILTFLLLPLFSYYLTTGDFGIYDIILTTISLLVPFVTMQFSEASYRWLLDSGDDEKAKSVAITNGFTVIFISAVVYCAFYVILSRFIDFKLTIYFPVILFVSSFLPFFQQAARGLGKKKLYSIAGIISAAFVLLFNVCFLILFKLKLESLLLAMVLSNSIVICFLIISTKVFRFFEFKNLRLIHIKAMLKYSWPLIPNTISWWLINAADKYIILYVLHAEANGIYGVSSRFPAIIALVNSVFLMAWQDEGITSKETDYSTKNSFFARTFHKFIAFELTFVAILICISQYLVKYFLDPKFYDSWRYIPFLFLGVAYSSFSAYIGVAYQRAKKTKGIFTTTIIGGVVNILISLLFIKHIGLYAPALGTFVSFFIVFLVRKHETNAFSPVYIDKILLTLLTFWGIICVAVTSFSNVYINIIFTLFSIVIFVMCNRPLLKYGYGLLKRNK
ncbi:lipopolysaccharide biosynthesis protein [Pedobacter frigoris]|uniref:lipopolysaccharide biosynthesis protein n=1 Tax=Pedobacter frigoris TaxID=2571272 RepID=UPI0029312996|nr:oligosaccharide flippase family protein [Pedobacter frigoris]